MTVNIPFAASISVPESVLIRELQGESVLLNLRTEKYFGLDEVGTRMWAVLTSTKTIQAGYEMLLGEYEVEPEQLRSDVERLLSELVEHELVVVHG